jgi:hypothetical protein
MVRPVGEHGRRRREVLQSEDWRLTDARSCSAAATAGVLRVVISEQLYGAALRLQAWTTGRRRRRVAAAAYKACVLLLLAFGPCAL